MRLLKHIAGLSLLLALFSAGLMSCSPEKRAAKYRYLLDHKSGTESNTASNTVKESSSASGVAVSKEVKNAVDHARSFIGTPYKYAGSSSAGMDCSGLTSSAYSKIGIKLQRSSAGQATEGEEVKRKDLRPGDLVFFNAREGSGPIDHVGMVVEVTDADVKFIHAAVHGGVRYDMLNSGYWKDRFVTARRIVK